MLPIFVTSHIFEPRSGPGGVREALELCCAFCGNGNMCLFVVFSGDIGPMCTCKQVPKSETDQSTKEYVPNQKHAYSVSPHWWIIAFHPHRSATPSPSRLLIEERTIHQFRKSEANSSPATGGGWQVAISLKQIDVLSHTSTCTQARTMMEVTYNFGASPFVVSVLKVVQFGGQGQL
jgi:hypothetical protein